MDVNLVILIGRLGHAPSTRYTSAGKAVSNFSLATSHSWKDDSGERQSVTAWHQIVTWGSLAEICEKYLAKGSHVYIEGRIGYREYEDRSGEKRKATEITASKMVMLGGGKRDEAEAGEPIGRAAGEDDIPF